MNESLLKCYWCGGMGFWSVYPFLINGGRIENRICTRCANDLIPEDIKGHYGTPIPVTETGIERHWREEW